MTFFCLLALGFTASQAQADTVYSHEKKTISLNRYTSERKETITRCIFLHEHLAV